jgi:hypothetical protein
VQVRIAAGAGLGQQLWRKLQRVAAALDGKLLVRTAHQENDLELETRRLTDDVADAIERSLIRPQVFILLAIVVFGLLIERVGLAPAIVVVTVVAAIASREMRWRETLAVAVGLAALCVGLFIYLLGQPLTIWTWNF